MERSEFRAVLSDAEPDSDCPKDPLVFGREPKAPQPSRPYRSAGSAQAGAPFSFFSIPGGLAAKCRAGTVPARLGAEATGPPEAGGAPSSVMQPADNGSIPRQEHKHPARTNRYRPQQTPIRASKRRIRLLPSPVLEASLGGGLTLRTPAYEAEGQDADSAWGGLLPWPMPFRGNADASKDGAASGSRACANADFDMRDIVFETLRGSPIPPIDEHRDL